MIKEITIRTKKRIELIDITSEIKKIVGESQANEGVCTVFVPHTTAAVTINEKADPNVARDIANTLEKLIPYKGGYLHAEGNSDAHIKSSLIGASESILISSGKLILGTWQAVFFCEFDGPRTRRCIINVKD